MWIPTLDQAVRLGAHVFPTRRTSTGGYHDRDDATSLALSSLFILLVAPLLLLRGVPLAIYVVLLLLGVGLVLRWGSIRGAWLARRTRRAFERAGTRPGSASFVGEVIAVLDRGDDTSAIVLADLVGARNTTNARVATVRSFVMRDDEGRLACVEATDHALVGLASPNFGDVCVGSRIEVRGAVRRAPLPALMRLEGYREVPMGEVFSGSLEHPLFVVVR
jgi:hypothetical protein